MSKKYKGEDKTLYFFKAGNYVKIGTTGGSVYERIAKLQTGNPEQIELLAAISAMGDREFPVHQYLSHLHVRGEWFNYSTEIDELIALLKQRRYEFDHWDEIIEKIGRKQ